MTEMLPGMYRFKVEGFGWVFWPRSSNLNSLDNVTVIARQGDMCLVVELVDFDNEYEVKAIFDGQVLYTGPVFQFLNAWERVL